MTRRTPDAPFRVIPGAGRKVHRTRIGDREFRARAPLEITDEGRGAIARVIETRGDRLLAWFDALRAKVDDGSPDPTVETEGHALAAAAIDDGTFRPFLAATLWPITMPYAPALDSAARAVVLDARGTYPEMLAAHVLACSVVYRARRQT